MWLLLQGVSYIEFSSKENTSRVGVITSEAYALYGAGPPQGMLPVAILVNTMLYTLHVHTAMIMITHRCWPGTP